MSTPIILFLLIGWALSSGLKRYARGHTYSLWRVSLASVTALAICFCLARLDLVGVPISAAVRPLFDDGLGLCVVLACALVGYFTVQLIVNEVLLRDSVAGRLSTRVNVRVCMRCVCALLSIPIAVLACHAIAFAFVFYL